MTVTEQLMELGSWSIQLREDTPGAVTDQVKVDDHGFGHIIVTAAPIDPNLFATVAELAAVATYTGIYVEQKGRLQLGGYGLAGWLADAEGKGRGIVTTLSKTSASFSTWVTDLKPGSLSTGTYHSQSGTLTWDATWLDRRTALDFVCDRWGCEWQITPNWTLNAGTAAELYGSTPVAILTDEYDGHEPTIESLPATFEPNRDLYRYTTDVTLRGTGVTGSATTSSPYTNILGGAVVRRLILEDSTVTANENDVAQGQLDRRDSVARSTAVTTTATLPTRTVPVGSPVYLFSREHRIADTANEVQYRGELLWPEAARLVGATWGIPPGCGVYLRDVNADLVDLSAWYVPELGPSQLVLDALPATMRQQMRRQAAFR